MNLSPMQSQEEIENQKKQRAEVEKAKRKLEGELKVFRSLNESSDE